MHHTTVVQLTIKLSCHNMPTILCIHHPLSQPAMQNQNSFSHGHVVLGYAVTATSHHMCWLKHLTTVASHSDIGN